MADIELVIKIPEKEFGIDIDNKFHNFFSRLRAEIKAHCVDNTSLVCGAYELETINMFLKAFANATPLPKGHGDLIDRGELKTHFVGTEQGTDLEVYLEPTIIDAHVIIPADKESEEEDDQRRINKNQV